MACYEHTQHPNRYPNVLNLNRDGSHRPRMGDYIHYNVYFKQSVGQRCPRQSETKQIAVPSAVKGKHGCCCYTLEPGWKEYYSFGTWLVYILTESLGLTPWSLMAAWLPGGNWGVVELRLVQIGWGLEQRASQHNERKPECCLPMTRTHSGWSESWNPFLTHSFRMNLIGEVLAPWGTVAVKLRDSCPPSPRGFMSSCWLMNSHLETDCSPESELFVFRPWS